MCAVGLYRMILKRKSEFLRVRSTTIPEIRPQGHIFVEFKAPWFEITDSLPQFKRQASRSARQR